MNIIFITLVTINHIDDRNLYADLMRYFVNQGHHVTIISPAERRHNIKTKLIKHDRFSILRVKSPNIQKANFVEKAIGTFSIDFIIKKAIKKYLGGSRFDLAIYSTPPITLVNSIGYLKKVHSLKTYLLLKDIFPQNAVDLGFIKEGSFVYKYFRNKEQALYYMSDKIGCMSQANVDYVLKYNPSIKKHKVEICPNSVEVKQVVNTTDEDLSLRQELGISETQRVFIYGGNLGKPQGIDFLIEVLESQINSKGSFFIIIGSGTEYAKLEKWIKNKDPKNVIIRSYLPKEAYDKFVNISDIGLICLDHKFKIPNYPSRLLAYLENKKPVLVITDPNTDIGYNAEKRGYGKWSPSNNLDLATNVIKDFCTMSNDQIKLMGDTGYNFLIKNYTVQNSYEIIEQSILDLSNDK